MMQHMFQGGGASTQTRNIFHHHHHHYQGKISQFYLQHSCKRNYSKKFLHHSNPNNEIMMNSHSTTSQFNSSNNTRHISTTTLATILNETKGQAHSYSTSSSSDDGDRQAMIEKEEKYILNTISNVHSHLDQGVDFTRAEERDLWVENLLSYLENIAKSVEKITWLEGTKSFSVSEEEATDFNSLFDNPFETREEEVSTSTKTSRLENLIVRVLDVLHEYGKEREVQKVESSLSLSSIGLGIYSIMKRYAMEFERATPKEISKFLEKECFFSLNQNVMNSLLRYFADIKDKVNTVIVLKDMQQLQLGANEHTYNILIRYAMYGNDQNQVLKLVKHMKQQGLELNQETKDLLRQHRLM